MTHFANRPLTGLSSSQPLSLSECTNTHPYVIISLCTAAVPDESLSCCHATMKAWTAPWPHASGCEAMEPCPMLVMHTASLCTSSLAAETVSL